MRRSRACGVGALLVLLFAAASCGHRPEADATPPATAGGVAESATSPVAAPGPDARPAPPVPSISRWALDPENSSVGFVCKHVLTNVRGMFSKPSGTVVLDETTGADSKVDVSIDANGVTTGVEERDTHLKGPDFFDTAKYPVITFTSTRVGKSSATTYSVTGDLTMHGVTKPVTLAVTAPPPFDHAGGVRRGIEATATVNRKDFGIDWEFPGEGPGVVVGDLIKITIDAELVLQR